MTRLVHLLLVAAAFVALLAAAGTLLPDLRAHLPYLHPASPAARGPAALLRPAELVWRDIRIPVPRRARPFVLPVMWLVVGAAIVLAHDLHRTRLSMPQAPALAKLADLERLGRIKECYETSQGILATFSTLLTPEEEDRVRLCMAQSALDLGFGLEALGAFRRVLERRGPDPQVVGGLVMSYVRLGREMPRPYLDLLVQYVEATRPADPELLGFFIDQSERRKEAGPAWGQLAAVMGHWGSSDAATAALTAVLERRSASGPGRETALLTLASAKLEAGDAGAATDWLLKAVDVAPALREAHRLLRRAAERAGRLGDVRRTYETILERIEEPAVIDALEAIDGPTPRP